MEKKKDLLLDVDEVVCFPGFLEAINEFMGTSYVVDDFTEYYMDEVAIPKERFDDFNRFLDGRNLYEHAELLPYAKEVIEELNRLYNIFICSSCVNPFNILGSGRLFADKYNYLISSLPILLPENFIFTNAKHLIRADVQVDDRLSNLDERVEKRILFPSYHNKLITPEDLTKKGVLRAGYDWRIGWLEVAKLLLDPSQVTNEKVKQYIKKP